MATIETVTVDPGGTGDYLDIDECCDDLGGIAGGDLPTADKILKINCICTNGNPDTKRATFSGFTTDATRYVWLYVDPSYRPRHKWETGNKFRMEYTTTADNQWMLYLGTDYLRIEGLYMHIQGGSYSNAQCIRVGGQGASNEIRIEKCLFRSSVSDSGNYVRGVRCVGSNSITKVSNCIFYDFSTGHSSCTGIYGENSSAYIYFCTGVDNNISFATETNVVRAKCCLSQDDDNGFYGSFHSDSDYNASDIVGDAPGANSRNGSNGTVNFKNAGADDFWLAQADTNAIGQGTDLSADSDYPVADDIHGITRIGTPGIGSCEFLAGVGAVVMPSYTVDGEGFKGAAYFGVGDITMPQFSVDGTASREGFGIGVGTIEMPNFIVKGVGIVKTQTPTAELIGYEVFPLTLIEMPWTEGIGYDTLITDPTKGKTITRAKDENGLRTFQLQWDMATAEETELLRSFAQYHIGSAIPFYYPSIEPIPRPFEAATLGSTQEGTIAARTVYVAYTWGRQALETEASLNTATLSLAASRRLRVTIGTFPANVKKAWVYCGATSDTLYKQTTPITQSEGTWIEPIEGYGTGGGSPPSANTLTETIVVRFGSPAYKIQRRSATQYQIWVELQEERVPDPSRYMAVGRITMPQFTVDGAGTTPAVYGSGAITMPGFSVAGVGTQSTPAAGVKMGVGSITMPQFKVAGTAALAPPATYYVDPSGDDTNPGTSASPFATIQHGVDSMSPSDTLMVNAGTYLEAVTIQTPNITLTGLGTPKIQSSGLYGIYSGGVSDDVTITGFEITAASVGIESLNDNRWTVTDCRIHNCKIYGIHLSSHTQALVRDCAVSVIGNHPEARGIALTTCNSCVVERNDVYLVRRIGISSAQGTANTIQQNRISAVGTGVWLGQNEKDALARDNEIAFATNGCVFRDTMISAGYNRVQYNTFEDCARAAVFVGAEGTLADYGDVQYNLFKVTGAEGDVFVWIDEDMRGPNWIINNNMYWPQTGPNDYMQIEPAATTYATVAAIQAGTTWEAAGVEYSVATVADYGVQNIPAATEPSWVPLTMTVDSSSYDSGTPANTIDWDASTFWNTGAGVTDQWIIYDLGAIKSFDYVLLKPYEDGDTSNAQNIKIEVSDDKSTWTTVHTERNDNRSRLFIYEMATTAIGRYIRLWIEDNHGAATIRVKDCRVGSMQVVVEAADFYVDGVAGSDANSGRTPALAFATIQKALNVATAGETIYVLPATYAEQGTFQAGGVTLKGAPGAVIASANTYGLFASYLHNITIRGFEITGQDTGIRTEYCENVAVADCTVHGCDDKGIELVQAHYAVCEDNLIYNIGLNQEAMGIYCSGDFAMIRRNQVFFCKKNGIRIALNHDTTIRDNIVYTCWAGIDFNATTGANLATNNWIFNCIWAQITKHNTGADGTDIFSYNTCEYNSEAAWGDGINSPQTDYVQVKYCLFKNNGWLHILHDSSWTGSNILSDYNMYWGDYEGSGRPDHYYNDDDNAEGNTYDTVAAIVANTVHEDNGLEYSSAQVANYGASNLSLAKLQWVPIPLTYYSASSNTTDAPNTALWNHFKRWQATSAANEWVSYDFGGESKTWRWFLFTMWTWDTTDRPDNFKVQSSDNGSDWTDVYTGSNDYQGFMVFGELSTPVTSKYVRIFITDTYGGNAQISDFLVGNLETP